MLTRFSVCDRMCPFRDQTPLFAAEFSFQVACLGLAQGKPPCKTEVPDETPQAVLVSIPREGYGNQPLFGF